MCHQQQLQDFVYVCQVSKRGLRGGQAIPQSGAVSYSGITSYPRFRYHKVTCFRYHRLACDSTSLPLLAMSSLWSGSPAVVRETSVVDFGYEQPDCRPCAPPCKRWNRPCIEARIMKRKLSTTCDIAIHNQYVYRH